MKLTPVAGSSHVLGEGYDSENLLMDVEYDDGSIYEYMGVPNRVHNNFVAAPSKGKYLHTHVVGKYPERRLKEGKTDKGGRS